MNDPLFIAVDLGAGSGRVFLAGISTDHFSLEEVHRFHYPPSRRDGHLRWDIAHIFAEIKVGLREAGNRARHSGRTVASIGVDGWGVDYGLINADGRLCESPIAYRDERTNGIMEKVFERLSRNDIFSRTGIQFLVFNTLFQLYAHAQSGIPDSAMRLLLIPDLIHFFLTGKAHTEYSNATTTQMVNAQSGDWDMDILKSLDLPRHLLAEIVPAGTDLGSLKPELAKELGFHDVRVVAPATHDTGSAFLGAPLGNGWACISSGTWSLVGMEREGVLISPEIARQNFSNEGGAFGRIRFLKNVMGLWILESCRREWQERGIHVDYDSLLRDVETLKEQHMFVYPDDPRFLNPPSMLQAIEMQLLENGHRLPHDPPEIAKLILNSLAFRYASVLRVIESLSQQKFSGVHIVGGGSQNDYLNQRTSNASGLPVMAGPVEATVIGNVLVQAISNGSFSSVNDARRYVAAKVRMKTAFPRSYDGIEESARRYAAVEARYTK